MSVKALDLAGPDAAPDAIARRIVDELWSGGPEVEVVLAASGERLTPIAVPCPAGPDAAPALAPGAVIVASGGARGVTAAALLALARRVPARFALLGRSAVPVEDDGLAAARDEGALRALLLSRATAAGESPSPARSTRGSATCWPAARCGPRSPPSPPPVRGALPPGGRT